ncbi:MAG: GatB/YqeY domain-containing protein [Candidatus Hydrogenedentes bacterium]|nr:GatB/YqeY domain-containing protein [Candidatus Hydrogenedentota bacterium]
MAIKEQIQEGIKEALKGRDQARLDTLRMAKGAILIKEKEKARTEAVGDEEIIAVLRSEIRKRQQSMETYEQLGKQEAADGLKFEISVIEEFLPRQLSEADIEAKVRAFLAEHPDMNHAGKLTGALKKELGDAADGKVLNEVCRRVLGG